jgi:hypothetical protein
MSIAAKILRLPNNSHYLECWTPAAEVSEKSQQQTTEWSVCNDAVQPQAGTSGNRTCH